MAKRIKYEVRRFSNGLNNATSVFGSPGVGAGSRTRGYSGPTYATPAVEGSVGIHGPSDSFTVDPSDADSTNVWIRPVSGGVLEAYPAPEQIEAALSVVVTQAGHGIDSDGTDRVVIYGDSGAVDKVYTLDPTAASTAEGSVIDTSGTITANGAVASMVAFNDRICICNGVDQPIEIDIAAGTAAEINASPPSVTNATTTLVDVAGQVRGLVKYYISMMSNVTESAVSDAFGTIDASGGTNTEDGGQVNIDLSHADFAVSAGTVTTANGAGTTLIDSAATFQTDGVAVGMIVKNTDDGSVGTVTSVDSQTQLTLTALSGGTQDDFDIGEAYLVVPIYRLYRTFDGETQAHYLADLNPSSTRIYTDNVPEEDLGTEPINHGDQPPATLTDWVSHRGRLWGISGNDLYWSDPGTHDSWFVADDGNHIKVHKDDGDKCTALATVPEGLLVFKRNHIYLVEGDDNVSGFRLSTALSSTEGPNVGTPHVNSLVAVPGGIVFYWRNGVYAYSGGGITKISHAIESQWIDPTTAFPKDANVSLGYDRRYGHVYVAYDYAADSYSTFIFDINAAQWIGAAQGAAGNKFLYWPGSATAAPVFLSLSAGDRTFVRSLVSAAFDAPVVSTGKSRFTPSGAFSGSDPNTLKRWLWLDFFFTAGVAGKNVVITPSVDGAVCASISGSSSGVVTVPLPGGVGRKRVNIGELGYRLTYEFTSGRDDSEKPWGLYEVVAAYQEMPGRSV